MNLRRLADNGRRPGPFLTRRDDDNTTSRFAEVLPPSLEPTPLGGCLLSEVSPSVLTFKDRSDLIEALITQRGFVDRSLSPYVCERRP